MCASGIRYEERKKRIKLLWFQLYLHATICGSDSQSLLNTVVSFQCKYYGITFVSTHGKSLAQASWIILSKFGL